MSSTKGWQQRAVLSEQTRRNPTISKHRDRAFTDAPPYPKHRQKYEETSKVKDWSKGFQSDSNGNKMMISQSRAFCGYATREVDEWSVRQATISSISLIDRIPDQNAGLRGWC